jgi:xylulokinase
LSKYLLAHDLGTSGNKATLFKENGQIVASEIFTYKTYYSSGNCAEQNPNDWWNAVKDATRVLAAKVNPVEIAAVSFSGQMQGCACIDKNGEPLHNSLIWADQRATKESDDLLKLLSLKEFYKITGHRMSAANTIAKLRWIKNNLPQVYGKTYKVLNAKDFIIYKLTRKFLTEYTDASGTCGMDLIGHKWSEEIFKAAGLDINMMPDLYNSTDIAGYVTREAALECGLLEGTPVVCGGGDGVAAGVGAGCIEVNDTYCCMGTSAWVASTYSKPILDDNMTAYNFAHMISKDLYMPCGAMSACGPSFDWFKDNFADEEIRLSKILGVKVYDILNLKVAKSPPGAKGLLFLPYLLGERSPRWNPDAKGAYIGITVEHTKNDMLRAVLEGISFNLSIMVDLYKKEYPIDKMTIVGGCADDTWSQICADIYNVKCNKINYDREATSIGAAVAAGVGVGMFKDFSAVNKFIAVTKTYYPNEQNASRYQKLKPVFDEAYNSLVRVYAQLANIK